MEKDPLTYTIIGCAMKVHNTLGNGFQEVIYQRCLQIEFERANLKFGREVEQTIFYEDIVVGARRADFVVEDKVIVELKAVTNLEDVHLAQAKNYVVAYNFSRGLLLNFGSNSLQYKLIFNPRLNNSDNS
jgi:GxxExxY protein